MKKMFLITIWDCLNHTGHDVKYYSDLLMKSGRVKRLILPYIFHISILKKKNW